MKITLIQAIGKNFLAVITLLILTNLLEVSAASAQTAAMDGQPSAGHLQAQSQPSPRLRANVHLVERPLKFSVNYENPQGSTVKIRITAGNNKVLYDNAFPNSSAKALTYDLSSLEDGMYTFEISTTGQKYTKSFLVQSTTARAVISQETQHISADSSPNQVIQ